jgi:hypothetical protein
MCASCSAAAGVTRSSQARLEPLEDLAGLVEEGCVATQLAVLELCDGKPERDLELAEPLAEAS